VFFVSFVNLAAAKEGSSVWTYVQVQFQTTLNPEPLTLNLEP